MLLKKTFELFMLYLLDNLKTSFDILTGDVCGVCIEFKVVSERSQGSEVRLISNKDSLKDVCVRTYMRDCSSYRARSVTDERIRQFPCYENVAFKKTLEPHHPDSWFLCNNLREMSGGYVKKKSNKWLKRKDKCPLPVVRRAVAVCGRQSGDRQPTPQPVGGSGTEDENSSLRGFAAWPSPSCQSSA